MTGPWALSTDPPRADRALPPVMGDAVRTAVNDGSELTAPLQRDRAKGKRFVNSARPRQFERPTRDLSWWPIPGWISRWQLGLAGGLLGGLLAELALGLYIWSGDMPGLSGIVVGLVFGLAFGLLIGLRSMDRPMG